MSQIWFSAFGRLNCYNCTGFLKKCFILDIRHGSEHTLMSEYTRVLEYARVTFECHILRQQSEYTLDSEYDRVLNVLWLHKILNKILHHKYFTGF